MQEDKDMQIANLIMALPGAAAQGLIWGIMAIGVYLTFRVLDIADLTVDGTMCTGGAVCVMMMISGHNVWVSLLVATLAGMVAGLVTGIFHTFMGIPAILAGILTQLSLYSINLKIMGKANQAINVDKYPILISLRRIKNVPITQNTILIVALFIVVIIAILYWFFGTELGCSLRATGCNPNMSRAQGITTDFCNPLKCSSGSVSGLRRCKYWTWCYRYRTCCCHYRRSNLQPHLPQFRAPASVCSFRFYPLLSGSPDCYLDGY